MMRLQQHLRFAFCFLIAFIWLPIPFANAQNVSSADVAQQIYAQCMKTPDENFPSGQQKYCACTAQNIAAQISASDLATIASRAGKNASQDDIGKTLMSDSRFMGIIQQCLTQALGNVSNIGNK